MYIMNKQKRELQKDFTLTVDRELVEVTCNTRRDSLSSDRRQVREAKVLTRRHRLAVLHYGKQILLTTSYYVRRWIIVGKIINDMIKEKQTKEQFKKAFEDQKVKYTIPKENCEGEIVLAKYQPEHSIDVRRHRGRCALNGSQSRNEASH